MLVSLSSGNIWDLFSNCFSVSFKLLYRENSLHQQGNNEGCTHLTRVHGQELSLPFINSFVPGSVLTKFFYLFLNWEIGHSLCTYKNKYVTVRLGWGKEINLTYRKETSWQFIDFFLNRNGNSLLVHSLRRFLLLLFKSSLVKLTISCKKSF